MCALGRTVAGHVANTPILCECAPAKQWTPVHTKTHTLIRLHSLLRRATRRCCGVGWDMIPAQVAVHATQLSLSHTLSLSLALSLSHTRTLSLSVSHKQTHTHTHTSSLFLPLTVFNSHTHTHTNSHFLSLSVFDSHTLSLSL